MNQMKINMKQINLQLVESNLNKSFLHVSAKFFRINFRKDLFFLNSNSCKIRNFTYVFFINLYLI